MFFDRTEKDIFFISGDNFQGEEVITEKNVIISLSLSDQVIKENFV